MQACADHRPDLYCGLCSNQTKVASALSGCRSFASSVNTLQDATGRHYASKPMVDHPAMFTCSENTQHSCPTASSIDGQDTATTGRKKRRLLICCMSSCMPSSTSADDARGGKAASCATRPATEADVCRRASAAHALAALTAASVPAAALSPWPCADWWCFGAPCTGGSRPADGGRSACSSPARLGLSSNGWLRAALRSPGASEMPLASPRSCSADELPCVCSAIQLSFEPLQPAPRLWCQWPCLVCHEAGFFICNGRATSCTVLLRPQLVHRLAAAAASLLPGAARRGSARFNGRCMGLRAHNARRSFQTVNLLHVAYWMQGTAAAARNIACQHAAHLSNGSHADAASSWSCPKVMGQSRVPPTQRTMRKPRRR